MTSDQYNLIYLDVAASPLCKVGGNLTGNILGQDPRLGPLSLDGGPTLNHLLLALSPAINSACPETGSTATPCEVTDQRGVTWPVDGRCDMGAVEAGFQVRLPVILR